MLFRLANEFDIRHHNQRQRDDYDEAFLDRIFWWYLATIKLLETVSARASDSQRP